MACVFWHRRRSLRPDLDGERQRCVFTPSLVTAPAWPLCSSTGSAALLMVGSAAQACGLVPHCEDLRVRAGPRRPRRRRSRPARRLERQQRGSGGPDHQSVPWPRGSAGVAGEARFRRSFVRLALIPRDRWALARRRLEPIAWSRLWARVYQASRSGPLNRHNRGPDDERVANAHP